MQTYTFQIKHLKYILYYTVGVEASENGGRNLSYWMTEQAKILTVILIAIQKQLTHS